MSELALLFLLSWIVKNAVAKRKGACHVLVSIECLWVSHKRETNRPHHRRLLPPPPPPARPTLPLAYAATSKSRQYIVREGDVGELFYMIVEGTVDVLEKYCDPQTGSFRWNCGRVLLPCCAHALKFFLGRVDLVLLFFRR